MKFALMIPVILAIGLSTGLLLRPSLDTLMHVADEHEDDHDLLHDDHHEEDSHGHDLEHED